MTTNATLKHVFSVCVCVCVYFRFDYFTWLNNESRIEAEDSPLNHLWLQQLCRDQTLTWLRELVRTHEPLTKPGLRTLCSGQCAIVSHNKNSK